MKRATEKAQGNMKEGNINTGSGDAENNINNLYNSNKREQQTESWLSEKITSISRLWTRQNKDKRECAKKTQNEKEEITTDTTRFKKDYCEQICIKIFENRDEENSQENIKYCNCYKNKESL